MSLGIGAFARLALQDDMTVIYEYGAFNWNEEAFKNEAHVYDGTITIAKSCFIEPEIHEKIKKMPSGRKKLIVKRIPRNVDYRTMIKDGLIIVENCSNCWQYALETKTDSMAMTLLYIIFKEYQLEGVIPEETGFLK